MNTIVKSEIESAFPAAIGPNGELPKLIDTARDLLVKKTWPYGSIMVGGHVTGAAWTNCHSALDTGGVVWFTRLGGIGIPGVDGSTVHPKIATESQKAWLAWYLGPTSPWSDVVSEHNQDIDFAIEHGLLIVPDHQARNYAYNALIASRFPTEFHECCAIWFDLVKKGVHPNIAMLAVSAKLAPELGHAYNNNHSAIVDNYMLTAKRFEGFARGKPENLLSSQSPACRIWGADDAFSEQWAMGAAFRYPEAFTGAPVRAAPWGAIQIRPFDYINHWQILLKEQERLGL